MLPGDILLTRNAGDDGIGEPNSSPGYWNHCAIASTSETIVEAQMEPGEVITAEWPEFFARYPQMVCLRPKQPRPVALCLAAVGFVGWPYLRRASLFRRLRERGGVNCVSLIRRVWKQAYGVDPGWKIPDDVMDDDRLRLIWKKGASDGE